MKKLLVYLLILILNFNHWSYSASIISKRHISNVLKGCEILKDYDSYQKCFLSNIKKKHPKLLNNLSVNIKNKKDADLVDLLEISQIIKLTNQKNFISNKDAFNEWRKILNSEYGKKIKKNNNVEKIISNSLCTDKEEFQNFIKCFYLEFRNLNIYKNSDLITKRRIETIMLNSLTLSEENAVLLLSDKDDLFEAAYDREDGFDYFLITMNGLGTDFYKKRKIDVDYKRIIKFLVIAIIISLVAKKILSKTGSYSASSETSVTSSSSSSSSYSSTYKYMSSPTSSITQRPWFKYGYSLGWW